MIDEYDYKVMVFGNSKVGKTAFTHFLNTRNFNKSHSFQDPQDIRVVNYQVPNVSENTEKDTSDNGVIRILIHEIDLKRTDMHKVRELSEGASGALFMRAFNTIPFIHKDFLLKEFHAATSNAPTFMVSTKQDSYWKGDVQKDYDNLVWTLMFHDTILDFFQISLTKEDTIDSLMYQFIRMMKYYNQYKEASSNHMMFAPISEKIIQYFEKEKPHLIYPEAFVTKIQLDLPIERIDLYYAGIWKHKDFILEKIANISSPMAESFRKYLSNTNSM